MIIKKGREREIPALFFTYRVTFHHSWNGKFLRRWRHHLCQWNGSCKKWYYHCNAWESRVPGTLLGIVPPPPDPTPPLTPPPSCIEWRDCYGWFWILGPALILCIRYYISKYWSPNILSVVETIYTEIRALK